MFRSHTPPPVSGIEYWRFESLEPGDRIKGWKAGHLIGIPCHHCGTTKPCMSSFTDGDLKCNYPHEEFPVSFQAYLPIHDDDGQRLVIGIRRNQFAKACQIPVGVQIEVSRGKRKTLPVTVVEKTWAQFKSNPGIDPLHPADIHAWLLRLWGNADLIAWVKRHPVKALAGELDTSKFVSPPKAVEKPFEVDTSDLVKVKEKLGNRLSAWTAETNGNGHTKNGKGDALDAIPKCIDTAKLPASNPVSKRYGKRGVK